MAVPAFSEGRSATTGNDMGLKAPGRMLMTCSTIKAFGMINRPVHVIQLNTVNSLVKTLFSFFLKTFS